MKRRVISVKSEQNNKMNYNNYNKNRRNKNSMTQDYHYNYTDDMNDDNCRNDDNGNKIN